MTSAIPPAMLDGVRRMDGSRRFLTLGGLVLALALIWALVRYADRPVMDSLYRGLELRDAAAMADALQKAGIRYELGTGGSELLVASGDVARARVAIAREGIRAGGDRPGDELLDQSTWVKTERERQTMERRALEGELARSLERLHGIDRATVHLSLPEASPLRKLDRPAKASVVLNTQGGRLLSAEEVASITSLVAGAVDKLEPDQVAVLDAEGHLLSAPNDATGRGLTSRQLDVQRSVEDYLGLKAQQMLATVLGSGGARVQVSAKLNFEQVEKSIETYNPDGAVLQNEQRSEVTGADTLNGGNSTVVNNTYQNSRVMERVVGSVGGVERLTVAVLLNDKAVERAAGTGPQKTAALAGYEQMVRNAIGIDSARGDRLTVTALPFEVQTVVDSAPATGGGTDRVLVIAERFSRPAIGLVGILAALVLALRVLRQGGEGAGFASATGRSETALRGAGEPDIELPSVKVPALNASTSKLKNEVQQESNQRPEMAASVVKTWLAEGGAG
jgi:flagellar M-ring protein FliF